MVAAAIALFVVTLAALGSRDVRQLRALSAEAPSPDDVAEIIAQDPTPEVPGQPAWPVLGDTDQSGR